jgi:glycosidase
MQRGATPFRHEEASSAGTLARGAVRRPPKASVALGAFAACVALFAACSDAQVTQRDFGEPPPPPRFDPGDGRGGNGGYGSGVSNSGGGDTDEPPPPPVCPQELRRCESEFTFPDSGQTSVEIRGNWGGDATWQAGIAMAKSGGQWRATVPVPIGEAVEYKFCVNGCADGALVLHPTDPTVQNGIFTNNVRAGTTCTEFVCDEGVLPEGVFDWRDSVIYFVFVDRFFDGRPQNNCNVPGVGRPGQYQGGDWVGLTQKINENYFNDLGVNTLWITVPADNTNERGRGVGADTNFYSAYHGYWPNNLDPKSPEGCFGTAAELKALVTAAHAKGIKVLFDHAMVHVHTSAAIYQQNRNWFFSNDNGRGGDCVCGQGCDWNADSKRCWFTDYLPHWNYTVKAARDYSVGNAIDWIKEYDIDGFRLDAIKHIDDSWLDDLRRRVQSEIVAGKPAGTRFYMVGETFSYNRAELRYYVDPVRKLDGQFDFPLRLEITKSILMRQPQARMSGLAGFMDGNDPAYGPTAIMSPWVGNHDLARPIHMAEDNPLWDEWSNGDKARGWSNQPGQPDYRRPYERLANAFAVIFTNRGAPLLYYGDEFGLAGAGDPDNRRFMPWSGYNSHQTWLRDRVRKLLKIRQDHPALRRGTRARLEASDNLWVYSMTARGDVVYVAINRGDSDETARTLPSGALTELLEGGTVNGPNVTIPARQTRIFVRR